MDPPDLSSAGNTLIPTVGTPSLSPFWTGKRDRAALIRIDSLNHKRDQEEPPTGVFRVRLINDTTPAGVAFHPVTGCFRRSKVSQMALREFRQRAQNCQAGAFKGIAATCTGDCHLCA